MLEPGSHIMLQDRTSWLSLLFSPIALLLGLFMFTSGFSELHNQSSMLPIMLLLLGTCCSGFAAYSVLTARHRVEIDLARLELRVSRGIGPIANVKTYALERGAPLRLVYFVAAEGASSFQLFVGEQHIPLQFSAPGSEGACMKAAEALAPALGVEIERK